MKHKPKENGKEDVLTGDWNITFFPIATYLPQDKTRVRITTFRITTLEDYRRSRAKFLQIELEKAGFEHC